MPDTETTTTPDTLKGASSRAIAQACLDQLWTTPNGRTLRFWRDSFWTHEGPLWLPKTSAEVQNIVWSWLLDRLPTAKLEHLANLIQSLRSYCLVRTDRPPPFYIADAEHPAPASSFLSLSNGLLDLESLVSTGSAPVVPHHVRWFNVNYTPIVYDPEAKCPVWTEFLNQVLCGDPLKIQLLQQWFGLCLTSDTRYQTILVLVGLRRSGKGTICRTLEAVVGRDNTVWPLLRDLATPFGLSPLLDKTVAIISDAETPARNAKGALEALKAISGEDPSTVNRKYRDHLTTQLLTRFVISCNSMPNLEDREGALAARFRIIRLPISFEGREDRTLGRRIMAELPGIFNWAIEGLRSLRATNELARPLDGEAAKAEYRIAADPARAFLEAVLEERPAHEIKAREISERYTEFCTANNFEPENFNRVGRLIRELYPSATYTRRGPRDARSYVYTNLAFKEPA